MEFKLFAYKWRARVKRKKSEKGREQELTAEELAKWIHLENYAASETCLLIAETDRVLCLLLCFNRLFPLDLPNEIQLLSGFFCYSWLVCLLGCGWEMRRLEIIVFKNKPLLVSLLRLAGCTRRLKSLKRFLSIYIAFDICLFFSGSWSRALSILEIELKCEFFREFLLKAHCYIPRLSHN